MKESRVNMGEPFPTNAQAAELVEPGKRALHHPSGLAEPAAVRGAHLRQHRTDLLAAQPATMRLATVGAVAL
jgi:hypothetical protein